MDGGVGEHANGGDTLFWRIASRCFVGALCLAPGWGLDFRPQSAPVWDLLSRTTRLKRAFPRPSLGVILVGTDECASGSG